MSPDTANPLLADRQWPDFPRLAAEQVDAAVTQRLAEYRQRVEQILADSTALDFDRAVAPLEAAADRLARSFSPVSHLHSVADTPAWRQAYLTALDALTAFHAELAQHRGLYERFEAVSQQPNADSHSAAERAVLADALRDFRLGGVALDEPARSRFRQISTELARLQAEFEQAVTDATDAWQLHLETSERLQGLPESALAGLREAAQAQSLSGYLLTLKAPCYLAIMTHAQDRDLRRTLYEAYQTRASDQGPQAGQYDNGPRMAQILALRHEAAGLLGYASAAHLSLATKMAREPQEVLDFLHGLVAKARPAALVERDQLQQFAAAELGLPQLEPWDVAFAAERQKERLFELRDEELKPYFPLPQVLQGLFDLCEELFGLQIRRRDDVPTWHSDVHYYEISEGGSARAGFYLDPFARQAKRGGAWMDVCVSRSAFDQQRLPVAYLTCNFAPPTGGKPALLLFDEVTTLFHEFGHGLHHMLTEVSWPRVGGIGGVEWDAVELPSQFLENFCWERRVLDRMARHVDTGEVLPQALYERMLAGRHYHAGLWLVRQLEFALFDFRMHLEYQPGQVDPVYPVLRQVREEVAVIQPPSWNRFAHAFGHIFAGGYAAGYYSYLWAEVLSADAFAAFSERDVLDPATGSRFRQEILAVGATRPALESFVAFRGREPELEPLLRSHGLAA
ncbi:MAG: M3 family metallopeptidase [Xanthomonadales bacterium]|nr:M3 family metallopeptidase [Xanthomonadales bacterium]